MAVPKKESLLAPFSRNFNDRIVAARETYRLSEAQVAMYTEKHTRFMAAYTTLLAMRAEGTWAESQTTLKEQCKWDFLKYARAIYTFVESNSLISDSDKVLLGIHIAGKPRRIPRPSAVPGVRITSVVGRTVYLNIYDSEIPTRRGRPKSIVAAWLYTFVGTDFPSNPAAWSFAGACTRRKHEITFPSDLPAGTKVWVCAAWINRKQEAGPRSIALSSNLQGGGSEGGEALKMAA